MTEEANEGWRYTCIATFESPTSVVHATAVIQSAFESNEPPAGHFGGVRLMNERTVAFVHERPDRESDYCHPEDKSYYSHEPDDDEGGINQLQKEWDQVLPDVPELRSVEVKDRGLLWPDPECPACGSNELSVITYAFHSIKNDRSFGLQLVHEDWSDEYAIECQGCGWAYDNPKMPSGGNSLKEALRQI